MFLHKNAYVLQTDLIYLEILINSRSFKKNTEKDIFTYERSDRRFDKNA